jgi:ribosomal protein S18 acetylase RimI-like enzyme
VTPEVRPFVDSDLDGAAELLAERHRRHRIAEPLLPEAFEAAAAARAEIEALWRAEGATGAVAVRHGRLAGYLIGTGRDEAVWGPNGWVETAGHAAEDAEDVRDLYAAVAQGWVDDGRTRHWALVPAGDAALVDAWFRLSFGQQQVYATREVDTAARRPAAVRPAEPRDLDALVGLAPVLPAAQERAPAFAFQRPPEDPGELRADIEREIANDAVGLFVAEVDGRVAGSFLFYPVEMSSAIAGLLRPPHGCYLAWGATLPSVRGAGLGLALMQAGDAWAAEAGHRVISIDWRVANLVASRFWPRRGFRPTFLRLSRSVR